MNKNIKWYQLTWSKQDQSRWLNQKDNVYIPLFRKFGVKRKPLHKLNKLFNNQFSLSNNVETAVLNSILLSDEVTNLGTFEISRQVSLRQLYDDNLHGDSRANETIGDQSERDDFFYALQDRSVDFVMAEKTRDFYLAINVNGGAHKEATERNLKTEAVFQAFKEVSGIDYYVFHLEENTYTNEVLKKYKENFISFLKNHL
jgi:hypothetical protein